MSGNKDAISLRNGYRVRVIADGDGFRAKLYGSASPDPIMKPYHDDKISALTSLISELRLTGGHDAVLADEIEEELEKALGGTAGRTRKDSFPRDIEVMFREYQRLESSRKGGVGKDSLVMSILGDEAYTKQFKMPKWNILVSMLQEPKVAVRHQRELGVSTSKSEHWSRATYLSQLCVRFQEERNKLIVKAEAAYGGHGPFISGAHKEHFPEEIKERLRFLGWGYTLLRDAQRLHETLSRSRSPLFR
jgi:hypothetical protein